MGSSSSRLHNSSSSSSLSSSASSSSKTDPVTALTLTSTKTTEKHKAQLKKNMKRSLTKNNKAQNKNKTKNKNKSKSKQHKTQKSESHVCKIVFDMSKAPVDLEDPQIIALIIKYLAKYHNNARDDVELKINASLASSNYENNNNYSIPVQALMQILPILQHSLVSLKIGRGCQLEGDVMDFLSTCIPQLSRLQKLSISHLGVSACCAATAFVGNQQLQEVSLGWLQGDFQYLMYTLQTLPHLKKLSLRNMYLCSPCWVVQAAASLLAVNTTLQELRLSFADEYDCASLEPLALALSHNQQSALRLLQVKNEISGCNFPMTKCSELDLFLQMVQHSNTTLQDLRLTVDKVFLLASAPPRELDDKHEQYQNDEVAAMLQNKIQLLDFYLRLNKYQRKRLLVPQPLVPQPNQNTIAFSGEGITDHPANAIPQQWLQAIIQAKQDPAVVFYYLSQDPTLIPSSN